MRVVNPPAFLRILMMSVGADDGAGAAAGDWAEVMVVEMEKQRATKRSFIITFTIILLCLLSREIEKGGDGGVWSLMWE